MKQISRILALLLAVVFMFAMVSCDKDNEANKNAETDNKSAETSADTKTELTEEEYDNLFRLPTSSSRAFSTTDCPPPPTSL